MPLAAASLYNFEARKSAPALGRRAAPTSLGQRAAPQALGSNTSAAAAERRLWKWYVDRLLMFDQYETPPQWEVGGDVAEFAAPHFHIVPGKSRPEAAALHLQRAWRTQRARREWAARTIQLRVQALQSRRAAARLTPAELEQRRAHRAAARSARQASVAKGSMEARELSARHHALFHGDLDGSRRRAAAASAPAYGVGACGGPAPTFSSPGRQRRCTTVAEMAERGGTWRRGGLHQEFMRGAHGGRVRADKQHGARAARAELAARRASTELARAARRGAATGGRLRGVREGGAASPGFDDAPGSAVFADAELDGDGDSGRSESPVGQRSASSGGADWSWSPCGTRHPPTPMQQSRSVPTLNFQRVRGGAGGAAISSRRTPGRTPRTPQTAHSTYTSSGPLSAMSSGRRGSYGTLRVSLPREGHESVRSASRSPGHARSPGTGRSPSGGRSPGWTSGASGASSHSSPASERGPSTSPQRNSSTSPGARRAPSRSPGTARSAKGQTPPSARKELLISADPASVSPWGRRGDGPPSPNMRRSGATSPSGSRGGSRGSSFRSTREESVDELGPLGGANPAAAAAPAAEENEHRLSIFAAPSSGLMLPWSPSQSKRALAAAPPPEAEPAAATDGDAVGELTPKLSARGSARVSARQTPRSLGASSHHQTPRGSARGSHLSSKVVTPRGNVMLTHGSPLMTPRSARMTPRGGSVGDRSSRDGSGPSTPKTPGRTPRTPQMTLPDSAALGLHVMPLGGAQLPSAAGSDSGGAPSRDSRCSPWTPSRTASVLENSCDSGGGSGGGFARASLSSSGETPRVPPAAGGQTPRPLPITTPRGRVSFTGTLPGAERLSSFAKAAAMPTVKDRHGLERQRGAPTAAPADPPRRRGNRTWSGMGNV